MLYIQFEIKNTEKYYAFKKVYKVLYEIKPKQESRPLEFWEDIIPAYSKKFLEGFYKHENARSELVREDFTSMVNYLEFGLDADFIELKILSNLPLKWSLHFNELKILNPTTGQVDFAALGFPYGGMDKLLMFLKSYEFNPKEVYNGFAVCKLNWTSKYAYEAIELPEKTKAYLNN